MSGSLPISVRPTARDALLRLPNPTRRRLQHAIDGLADDTRPTAAVALAGHPGALRLRVDDRQLIYTAGDKEVVILVVASADIL